MQPVRSHGASWPRHQIPLSGMSLRGAVFLPSHSCVCPGALETVRLAKRVLPALRYDRIGRCRAGVTQLPSSRPRPPSPRATPGRPPIAEARRDIAYLLLTGRLTDGQMDTQTPPFHGMQLCNNAACRDSSGDKKDVHHQQRRVDSHIQLLGILRPTMLCVCTTVSLRSPITDREVSVPSSQEGKESVAQAGRKPTTIQHLTHPSVTPIRNFVNRASPVISFFFRFSIIRPPIACASFPLETRQEMARSRRDSTPVSLHHGPSCLFLQLEPIPSEHRTLQLPSARGRDGNTESPPSKA